MTTGDDMMLTRFGFPQRTSVRVLLAACAVLVAAVLCVPAAALASAGASSVQVDAVPEGYTGWAEDAAGCEFDAEFANGEIDEEGGWSWEGRGSGAEGCSCWGEGSWTGSWTAEE